jgi:shikimate dehydrogenase
VISDRDASRASGIARDLSGQGVEITAGNGDPTGFDLVFNATPLGLGEDDPAPLDVTRLAPGTFVGDVIAGHGTTPLIAAARERGCATATGDDMVEAVQQLMADFLVGD